MDKNLIVVESKNIFQRIKLFFYKLFGKEENSKEVVIQEKKEVVLNSFNESIKIDSNIVAINDYKTKLENGIITAIDIPEKYLDELIKQYDEDNDKLEKEILKLLKV